MDYIKARRDDIAKAIDYVNNCIEQVKTTNWETEKLRLQNELAALEVAYEEVMQQIPVVITATFNGSYTVTATLKYKTNLIEAIHPPTREGHEFDGFYVIDKKYGGRTKVEQATEDMHVYGFWDDDLAFRDFRLSLNEPVENKRIFNHVEGTIVIEQINCPHPIVVRNCYFNKLNNIFNWIIGTTSITLENCTTNNFVMNGMFNQCIDLQSISMSFNTNQVTSLAGTYAACITIENIDLSELDFTNLQSMMDTFNSCYKLKSIIFPSTKTTNLKDMSLMLANCHVLEEIDFACFDTSNVTDARSVFAGCTKLNRIKNVPSSFVVDNSNNVIGIRIADTIVKQNLKFVEADGADWIVSYWNEDDVSFIYNKEILFTGRANPEGLTLNASVDQGTYLAVTCGQIFVIDDEVHRYGEYNFAELEIAPLLVYSEKKLTVNTLEDFNNDLATGKTEFEDVVFVESINGFNSSKALTFNHCYFAKCAHAFENQTIESIIFNNCKFGFKNPHQLANLSWADASNMFANCTATRIEFHVLDNADLTEYRGFFNGCGSLTTIVYDKELIMDYTIPNRKVFEGCEQLVGGNGTVWSAEHVDLKYAIPDTDKNPGYFTM